MPTETSSNRPATGTTNNWAEFRDLMPIAQTWAYFDHAAIAPLPQPTLTAISKWANECATCGDSVWPDWKRQIEECRHVAAELINAADDEIALIPNTTFGINLVADGLDWRSGDNVVLPDHEFPSNVYPWMALEPQGVEVRKVPLDGDKVCLDRIVSACDERTRVVSVSWVGYASGYRIDPKTFASAIHDAGALFFLDAIQGLGVFPLDVKDADIDFLAADGHKWMLGPEGAGIFYLKTEHLDLLRPINVGWNSAPQNAEFSLVDFKVKCEASRYEGGTPNTAGFIGLRESLRLLQRFGLNHASSPIAERVLQVSSDLCEALSASGARVKSTRGDDCSSGIVAFEVPGFEPADVRSAVMEKHVNVSCRGGYLRAATHCYNDAEDIGRLTETIRQLLNG